MGKKKKSCKVGTVLICAGVAILMILMLPAGILWFLGGAALIAIGIACSKSCK